RVEGARGRRLLGVRRPGGEGGGGRQAQEGQAEAQAGGAEEGGQSVHGSFGEAGSGEDETVRNPERDFERKHLRSGGGRGPWGRASLRRPGCSAGSGRSPSSASPRRR